MGKFLDQFANSLANLTPTEKQVLYYIDQHTDEASGLSLTEIAKVNNVSTTTVVRMSHKLGLDGFSELKYLLRKKDYTNALLNSSPIELYKEEFITAFDTIQPHELERLSEKIYRAKRVIVVGVGLSKMMAEYFSKLLMQTNKQTHYTYESHMIDLLPNMVKPEDLVFFISSSGETKTLIQAAEKLSFLVVDTAAITNSADSSLGRTVKANLSMTVEKAALAGYDITARSTLMLLIDLLFADYLKKSEQ
ncbi:MurR/RpiR family transcriptional regulator [Jeotgalibacillus proteolyticus]|uniref:MurR/RpiR family transcriptional regulator n=1 Tax=Jeotgalibacillus proteolyticus TaxID=2082395 RepID=A0A2S5GBF1_9BACL|nr:MurR/RpiR family transcriptional regulator [Jeotgalibacillus proteolyticus]PPA70319.1 MurR/RpiR family transcriptional regulator [Jeotgalibacillus proteolyticus]